MTRFSWLYLGILFAAAGTAAAAGPSPVGDWQRHDGTSRIRIAPCGARLCAVNTWVSDPDGDEKKGDTLVMTLRGTSPNELSGEAYDTRRRITYSMTISLAANTLQTRGCVMLGMVCRSAEWTRIP